MHFETFFREFNIKLSGISQEIFRHFSVYTISNVYIGTFCLM